MKILSSRPRKVEYFNKRRVLEAELRARLAAEETRGTDVSGIRCGSSFFTLLNHHAGSTLSEIQSQSNVIGADRLMVCRLAGCRRVSRSRSAYLRPRHPGRRRLGPAVESRSKPVCQPLLSSFSILPASPAGSYTAHLTSFTTSAACRVSKRAGPFTQGDRPGFARVGPVSLRLRE